MAALLPGVRSDRTRLGRTRHGLTLDPKATAHVADVVHDGDLVIAVCDTAHEDLTGPIRPGLHWSVPDPVRIGTDAAFEAAYADLADRVDRVAPVLNPGGRRV